MLRSIRVRNMALIREEEITLEPGLNILTGETGAGKSIVIGSVSAALGAGSFRDLAADGEEEALVELTFETDSDEVRKLMEEAELPDMDGLIVITRKIRGSRSISRINGETVPVSRVRELASLLIDIHGQHEHQSLLHPKNHLALIDSFAGEEMEKQKAECAAQYRTWKDLCREMEEAEKTGRERLKQLDFLSFEVQEIDDASLEEGEDERLESLFRRLSNAQRIMEVLSEVHSLTDADEGAGRALSKAGALLSGIAELDEDLSQMNEMLVQIEDLCSDLGRELSGYMDDFTFDEEKLRETEERLDLINRLKAKYGREIPDILAYREERAAELEKLENYDAWTRQLETDCRNAEEDLEKTCKRIRALREKSARELEGRIAGSLQELNFPDVVFRIELKPMDHMSANGADEALFLISTNPGRGVKPLQDAASGGELSRIMLGIKTVMAEKDGIGSMIFDEIDTGISGRTAQKVSEKMAQLSGKRQVIAITHLAQIAAMADSHYLIEKQVEGGSTFTHIRLLSEEERTEELARILGGARITDAVRANAAEMRALAQDYKDGKKRR